MRRTLAFVCGTAALFSARAAVADPETVHVVVSDGASAIKGARVFERDAGGSAVFVGTSDATGALDVTVGDRASLFAEIGDRKSPLAAARLGRVQLVIAPTVIASVSAHREPATPRLVTASSAAAVSMGDPAAALGLIANYRSRAEGGSGHEALNGVPLEMPSLPGSNAGGATSIPSDLIDSFSAVQADDGSVTPNYHVLGPTDTTQLRVAAGSERYDGGSLKAMFSGRSGRLGYGLVVAGGHDEGLLSGRSFVDASGIDYDHASHARHTDASLELDYRLGTTQVSLVALGSRATRDDVADLADPGGVPLGFGPGNTTRTGLATGYIFAGQTHGRDTFHLIDARFGGGLADDQSHAQLAGIALAANSGYRYWGEYDEFGFTRQYRRESLTFKASATRVTTLDYVNASAAAATALQHDTQAAYEHGDYRSGYGGSLGAVSRVGGLGGTTIEENVHVHRQIAGAAVRLTAYHAQSQTIESSYAGLVQWAAPASASYTCGPATATLTGPGNVGSKHPEATTISAAVDRSFAHGVTLSAGGFISSFSNMLVQPATQIAQAELPTGYAGALTQIARTACPGANDLTSVFVQNYHTVPHAFGKEWYADLKFPVGPLRAETTFETYSVVANAIPTGLTGTHSTLVARAQLPGIPLHRGNLIVSYANGRALFAAALQYVSDNNAAHLPGHVNVSAGLQLRAATGTLSFSATNLFAAYRGLYASPQNAVAIAADGPAVAVLATPEKTIWQLRYTTNFGRRTP